MITFLWFIGSFSLGAVAGVFFAGAYIQRCKRYISFLEATVAAREREVSNVARRVVDGIRRLGEGGQ